MEKILENLRRTKPSRIIVGELRGEQLNDALKAALHHGHPGLMTTIHCDYSRAKEIFKNRINMLRKPR